MATMIQDIDTDPAMSDEKRFIEIDPPPPYSSLSEKWFLHSEWKYHEKFTSEKVNTQH